MSNTSFYEFEAQQYDCPVTDADAEYQAARQGKPFAPHGQNSSAKVIAEYSKKNKILSAEELFEHRKYCKAKPGNCPFEKAMDEADDITPNQIKVTKATVFNRFAALLTQMFNISKNLAKPAIADVDKIKAKTQEEDDAEPAEGKVKQKQTNNPSPTKDEAPLPSDETREDSMLVAEIIEKGIETMVNMAKDNGCKVQMDDQKSRYMVEGPTKES